MKLEGRNVFKKRLGEYILKVYFCGIDRNRMKLLFFLLLLPFWLLGQSISTETEQLFKEKKYSQAEEHLTTHIESNPDDIAVKELLADAYAYQEKWDEAIKLYKNLTRQDPANADYWYKYGGAMGLKALSVNKISAFFMIDDIKEALLKSASLDSRHIEVRWALVEFYIQLPGLIGGSRKKALYYADELEAISKVDGYLAKGYIYEYDDDPEQAETYYKKAVVVGGSVTCFSKLASFYEKENPEKAIETIENASEKLNRNALNYQLGKVCATYNLQLEKGEKCLKKYISNYSVEDGVPLEWAYYNLAKIYRHKKDKTNALQWINKALMAQPKLEKFVKEKASILKL